MGNKPMQHDYSRAGVGPYTGTHLVPFDFTQVWSDITDLFLCDQPFKASMAIGHITCIARYAVRGQCEVIREVLMAVEAEGNNQVKRLSRSFWVLPSINGPYD